MKNIKEVETTTTGLSTYANVKVTNRDYCQSCSKKFTHAQTVFFAWLDGTIICRECTKAHAEVEIRLFLED